MDRLHGGINMKRTIEEMNAELERLISQREGAVGITLKRVNYRIAELQNRIDHSSQGR